MPRKTINPKNGETLKIDGESSVQFRRHKRKRGGRRLAVTINTAPGVDVKRQYQRIRD